MVSALSRLDQAKPPWVINFKHTMNLDSDVERTQGHIAIPAYWQNSAVRRSLSSQDVNLDRPVIDTDGRLYAYRRSRPHELHPVPLRELVISRFPRYVKTPNRPRLLGSVRPRLSVSEQIDSMRTLNQTEGRLPRPHMDDRDAFVPLRRGPQIIGWAQLPLWQYDALRDDRERPTTHFWVVDADGNPKLRFLQPAGVHPSMGVAEKLARMMIDPEIQVLHERPVRAKRMPDERSSRAVDA